MNGDKAHKAVFDIPDAPAEKGNGFQKSRFEKILDLTILAPAVALRILWESSRRAM
jgi:hypothetical protein